MIVITQMFSNVREDYGNMEIIRLNSHTKLNILKPVVACIGYFDGLHLGHQALIASVLDKANEVHATPALITFEPDPWSIIKPDVKLKHITTMNDRIKIGKRLGLKQWFILEFDEEMAKLTKDEFREQILDKLNLHTLICGFDFHYAHKGEGNALELKENASFNVNIIDEIDDNGEKISSSRIEKCINEGKMEEVTRLLSRPYTIHGIVGAGKKLGRTIGFPTANLEIKQDYIFPKKGVYAGEIIYKEKTYQAIINVGHNPTFNYTDEISLEVHILDFREMIYGEKLQVSFYYFIRDEFKFNAKEDLIKQLSEDEQFTRDYFRR